MSSQHPRAPRLRRFAPLFVSFFALPCSLIAHSACSTFGSSSPDPDGGAARIDDQRLDGGVGTLDGNAPRPETLKVVVDPGAIAIARKKKGTVRVRVTPAGQFARVSLASPPRGVSAPTRSVDPKGEVELDVEVGDAPLGVSVLKVRAETESGLGAGEADLALTVRGAPGEADTTFGVTGEIAFDYGGSFGTVRQGIVLSDDTILLGGEDTEGGFLTRYTKDGGADSTYGTLQKCRFPGKYASKDTIVDSLDMIRGKAYASIRYLPPGLPAETVVLRVDQGCVAFPVILVTPGATLKRIEKLDPRGSSGIVASGEGSSGWVATAFDEAGSGRDTSWGSAGYMLPTQSGGGAALAYIELPSESFDLLVLPYESTGIFGAALPKAGPFSGAATPVSYGVVGLTADATGTVDQADGRMRLNVSRAAGQGVVSHGRRMDYAPSIRGMIQSSTGYYLFGSGASQSDIDPARVMVAAFNLDATVNSTFGTGGHSSMLAAPQASRVLVHRVSMQLGNAAIVTFLNRSTSSAPKFVVGRIWL